MKNPGLDFFVASTFIKSPHHPLNIDPLEDDPHLESGENDSDYVPPVSFGRWRNPGQSIRVPVYQGPTFAPGQAPEDVVHGEIISPAEQDGADKIINGEHESDHPSANPFVEHARQDLRTPGSDVAVHTLSGLLGGAHPGSMPSNVMDAAHEWLSHRFTGVTVNPHDGTLEAMSPAGRQVAVRRTHLPAIPDEPAPAPTFSLTNKHGTFESHDPQRLVKTMVAFQIMHNEFAREQKKDEDDQNNGGLTTTSAGFFRRVRDAFKGAPEDHVPDVPHGAIFEPGHGDEKDEYGRFGGWVASSEDAPDHWHHDRGTGVAYSPGHFMGDMLDPERAKVPWPDPDHAGHTYTYAPNPDTGHTIERRGGGVTYFVNKLHPAARGPGYDVPKPVAPSAPRATPAGRLPKRGPRVPPHTPPRSLPPPAVGGGVGPVESSAQINDLCPVCASGYLEPYDGEHHECLNCGSLVKHVGFEKEAAARRKPGGLGRGLKDIQEYEGDPLGLAEGGSENADQADHPDGGYVHPLAGEQPDPDYEGYQAPRRILDKKGADEADPIDEYMGKNGFFPAHKPGQERLYLHGMQGVSGAYWRLTEGAPHPQTGERGWMLSADHIPPHEQWTEDGESIRGHSIKRPVGQPGPKLLRPNTDSGGMKYRRERLPNVGEHALGEKSFLVGGTHPVEDDNLARAIRDVHLNGRNSETYGKVFNTAFESRSLPGPDSTPRQRQQFYSSVGNPGLTRFVS